MALLPQPQRLVDTRTAGGPIPPFTSRCFTVAGQAGIPSNVVGALVNVTAVGYAHIGWLTLYPGGQRVPPTAQFSPGALSLQGQYAAAKGAIVRIGSGGQVCVLAVTLFCLPVGPSTNCSVPGSSTDLILDVAGYFTAGAIRAGMAARN